jgi:hypothetical protein
MAGRLGFVARHIVGLAVLLSSASGAGAQQARNDSQPLFHGKLHDCDAGDDFGGHLPKGFVCRGSGTGVGSCLKPGDRRVISYDVQGGPVDPPGGYCHLDWVTANESQLKQLRRYIDCKGSNAECAEAAFRNNPVAKDQQVKRETALGCEKTSADTMYCKNGKRREVCAAPSGLLWADTRAPVLRGQFTYLTMDGPIPSPHCGCIDATRMCESSGRTDCAQIMPQCNQALSSGGRFCMSNSFGGQTCF